MFNFLKKKNNTPKLPYTTEVHCHVLPGIDDGSPDVEHSLALIHQMKEWGLERIIATPHVTEASFENTPQTIGSAYSRLCQETNLDELGIKLCYSAEYRMDDNFLGILQREEIIPMPGNHILIENSFLQPFWNIKSLVFDLKFEGSGEAYAAKHAQRVLAESRIRVARCGDNAILQVCPAVERVHYFAKMVGIQADGYCIDSKIPVV